MRRDSAFLRLADGFTGAEKALLICFGLAIVAATGALVTRGSDKAAGDARRTLMEGGAGGGALGAVPISRAGAVASAAAVTQKSQSLVGFSSDFKGAAGPAGPAPPPPPPAPAPAEPRRPNLLQATYEPLVGRRGGQVTEVSIMRVGLLPRQDPVLAALRDGLGNADIAPDSVHGIVPVWRAGPGGSATVDADGNVYIRQGDAAVVIFKNGATQIVNHADNTNQSRDAQGRLRSFAFNQRSGTTISLARGFEFTYGADGKLQSAQVIGGPQAGTFTRQPDGSFRNERTGQVLSGANSPEAWPGVLGGRARLNGILDAASGGLRTEWARLQRMWSEALPQGGSGIMSQISSTMTSLRTVVGMGFSGEGGNVQRMSQQIQGIRTEMDSVEQLRRQIVASQDPSEIARLSQDYVRRADALKDRLDRFRAESERVLTRADRYGRAWEVARDAYGLWNAGGKVTATWNLQNLVRHSIGWAADGK